ncbi:MAG: UDP-3-O-acyl-N-acetylglucosamine deacetylase [Synergistales bacterium]|nr:UDP-3-O-acyl-N-acetylglucosamine deacetylase [Synergistales bacterium]
MRGVALCRPVTLRGIGVHSGGASTVTVMPPTGPGIAFRFGEMRCTLGEAGMPHAERGTELVFSGGRRVRTVEHLLAALTGLGVDHADIEIRGGEIPILDGSALPFVQAFREAGLCETDREKPEELAIAMPLVVDDPAGDRFVAAFPAPSLRLTYILEYANPHIGCRRVRHDIGETGAFVREIAPARTFALEEEVAALRGRSLAVGGALDNALVVGEDGPLNPGGFRMEGECVRHKMLDLLGDLALLGRGLKAHVVACRAGHGTHRRLVSRLRRLTGRR